MTVGVACRERGDLIKRLPSDITIFTYGDSFYDKVSRKIFRRLDIRSIASIHHRFRPDMWYINTILQPAVLRQSRREKVPCILHSHELEQMLALLTEEDLKILVEYPKLIIAASESVAKVFHILDRTNCVEVCYEPISLSEVIVDPEKSRKLRRSLNIAENTFVWTMSGTLGVNKNPGLFVDLACEMIKTHPDVHFLWIGESVNAYGTFMQEKARSLNLASKMTWAGLRRDDYYDFLNIANGFVLTSTRDSFPLVMMEAAALGKPIVSFNSGGVKEFIQPRMGTVIDSWNPPDLIEAMKGIMTGSTSFDPDFSREFVKRFDASVQAKHWESILIKYS